MKQMVKQTTKKQTSGFVYGFTIGVGVGISLALLLFSFSHNSFTTVVYMEFLGLLAETIMLVCTIVYIHMITRKS
jgi:hypothetical protein